MCIKRTFPVQLPPSHCMLPSLLDSAHLDVYDLVLVSLGIFNTTFLKYIVIQDVEDQRLSNNRCLQAETTSGLTSKPQGGTKETSVGPLKPIKTIPLTFFSKTVL